VTSREFRPDDIEETFKSLEWLVSIIPIHWFGESQSVALAIDVEMRLIPKFSAVGVGVVRSGVQADEADVSVASAEVESDFERTSFHVEDKLELLILDRHDQFLLPKIALPNEDVLAGGLLHGGDQTVGLGVGEHWQVRKLFDADN
jgi:hypothetical protein